MVYKRFAKRGVRKTFPRRRRYGRRNTSGWGGVAKKALRIATKVASLINTEYKYYDINVTPAVSTYNGILSGTLCAPAQGLAAQDRTGDSIKMKNLTMRIQFSQAANTDEVVRFIIFVDKQNTITTAAQLLQSVGNVNGVYSPKNDNNKYDSKFIHDKTYILDSDNPIRKLDLVYKLDFHEHFNAGTTTVDTGAIKFCFISQQATTGAAIQFYSRITYLDN